jgi:hypothetical protein
MTLVILCQLKAQKGGQKLKITSQGFHLYSPHNHLFVISATCPKPVPYGNRISRHGNLKN